MTQREYKDVDEMIQMSEQIEYIDPNEIKPDPNQPRTRFDEGEIRQLAETLDSQGVITPIEVDENNIIVLGERRWRASILKGLDKIPIRRKTILSQRERYERQLIDDVQRKSLDPMDRAWVYATSIININTDGNYTINEVMKMKHSEIYELMRIHIGGPKPKHGGTAELARIIGANQVTIWNYIQCVFLESGTQVLIQEGTIPYLYGRAVARLYPDHLEEKSKIEQMLRDGEFNTIQDIQEYVERYIAGLHPIRKKEEVNVSLELEDEVTLAKFMARAMRNDPFLPYEDVDDQYPYQRYGIKSDIRLYCKPTKDGSMLRKIIELKRGTVGARAAAELFIYTLAEAETVDGEIQPLLLGKSLSTGGRNMLVKLNKVLKILADKKIVPKGTKMEYSPISENRYYKEVKGIE